MIKHNDLTLDRLACLRTVAGRPNTNHDAKKLAPFCDEGSTLTVPDVFNQCHNAGWLVSHHDDRLDASYAKLTDEGRKAIERGKFWPWLTLEHDPPGPEHKSFFVGHSEGGRMDLVFRWPDGKGKLWFWCKGEHGNYILTGYMPDVWHPGPPNIPGSDVEAIQQGRLP